MPTPGISDTHPDMERLHLELMGRLPPWRKMEMMGEMWATMKTLMLVGLRRRHPAAGEEELQRRMADLLLGAELAEKVYGPPPYEDVEHVRW